MLTKSKLEIKPDDGDIKSISKSKQNPDLDLPDHMTNAKGDARLEQDSLQSSLKEPPVQPHRPITPYPTPEYPYPMKPLNQYYQNRYYPQPKVKRVTELSIGLIFLVCISIYWLPFIISGLIGSPFFIISEKLAEVIIGVVICIITFSLMIVVRKYLDNPTFDDYGFSTKNLGDNLSLTAKLIFIIFAVESLVVMFFRFFGVSFEGGPTEIDIFFVISAVIVAPIFEETVYRMNASTLLARRLPIIWVAGITSTWFIAKHVPMWHLDDNFGLPAILIISLVNIPMWTIVTYFFLKRKCIWIPFFVHMFNNGAIALFHFIPDSYAIILDFTFFGIGMLFLIIFGLPWIYKTIVKPLKNREIKFTKRTYYYLGISAGLTALFLGTSEALFAIQDINVNICFGLGIMLFAVSLVTVIYVMAQSEVVYVKK
jgi:membrane protease YdiL (CAAX protease family)